MDGADDEDEPALVTVKSVGVDQRSRRWTRQRLCNTWLSASSVPVDFRVSDSDLPVNMNMLKYTAFVNSSAIQIISGDENLTRSYATTDCIFCNDNAVQIVCSHLAATTPIIIAMAHVCGVFAARWRPAISPPRNAIYTKTHLQSLSINVLRPPERTSPRPLDGLNHLRSMWHACRQY